MKTIITLIFLFLTGSVFYAQNITNTLGTTGVFRIKDGSTDYLTLNQSNGNVTLFRNMELGGTATSLSTRGVITKNGIRFLHNYGSASNLFLGYNSGNFTLSGSFNTGIGYLTLQANTTGIQNTAVGESSLRSNTVGNDNSSFGSQSMETNSTGSWNSAFGRKTLFTNSTGNYNSAFGFQSLHDNTLGSRNSAFGFLSLFNNTLGDGNSAFGDSVMYNNTEGIGNSAFGNSALFNGYASDRSSAFGYGAMYNGGITENSAFGFFSLYTMNGGQFNSGFGSRSLYNLTHGDNNTAIGVFAGNSITIGNNNTAIGYNAQVPTGTANNQVRIGNTSVTYAGIQVAWTITSDRNLKSNILNSKLGLGFITKLRPVSYTRKNDESGKTEYGLIAQEVEDALKLENTENTGMLTVTDDGEYQLRYNDLIAPMIKAIQELKQENDELKKRLNVLEQNKIKEVNSEINAVNQ